MCGCEKARRPFLNILKRDLQTPAYDFWGVLYYFGLDHFLGVQLRQSIQEWTK